MLRARRLFVLWVVGGLVVGGGLVRPVPAAERSRYPESRRLLEAGAFERALRQMTAHPPQEVEQDPEGLVLRGLARWGAGLDRFTALAVKRGPFELISQVKQLADRCVRELPEGAGARDRIARALPDVEAQVARHERAAGDVERSANEISVLLRGAEADFQRAARLPRVTRAKWCEAPERWVLLARAHRLSIERMRALWGRDITGSAPPDAGEPERQQREQQLQALEKVFLKELDQQLAVLEGKPGKTHLLHAAADALLVYGLATNRISRWPESGGPHPFTRLEAAANAPGAKSAIREVRALVERDPVEAVVRLYRLCAEPRGSTPAAGTAYTNYLLDLQAGEATAVRLAALAADLNPQEVAGNPLFLLERARLLARAEGQEGAVQKLVGELGAGRLRRPVWTAAPAPIRTAFLRLPQWLRAGRQVSLSYSPVLDRIGSGRNRMDPPELRAQVQQLRLQLAATLATSDLPWDRETGYETAASALRELDKLQAVLTLEQVTAHAAVRSRLQAASGLERFPAQMCAVAADGNLVWVTNAFQPLSLSNPLVLVHRDGLTLAPPRPR